MQRPKNTWFLEEVGRKGEDRNQIYNEKMAASLWILMPPQRSFGKCLLGWIGPPQTIQWVPSWLDAWDGVTWSSQPHHAMAAWYSDQAWHAKHLANLQQYFQLWTWPCFTNAFPIPNFWNTSPALVACCLNVKLQGTCFWPGVQWWTYW